MFCNFRIVKHNIIGAVKLYDVQDIRYTQFRDINFGDPVTCTIILENLNVLQTVQTKIIMTLKEYKFSIPYY